MDKDDVEYDPNCDPANPHKVKFEDIAAATKRIVGQVVRTPCMKAHMSAKIGMELYYKLEFLQYTGCFKERGLRNALLLLTDEQRKNGVVAASSGNHGIAVSYHSGQMGIPSVVVMPENAPISKVIKCQRYGAKLFLHGSDVSKAKRFALSIAKEKKMLYVNGYDHPNVIAGQGSVGIEILEDIPDVDAIICSIGGGSLLVGTAVAVKHLSPKTKVYGIETDRTNSMAESIKNNKLLHLTLKSSIADGLRVNKVGVNTFYNVHTRQIVDGLMVVEEDWVARAIMRLVEEEKFVIEGAAATTVAGILAGLFPNLKGKKVVCVLSGGNIDTTTLARVLHRGMAADGRLVKFKVTVIDRPGGLAQLCKMLAEVGVTLRDCVPERAWIDGDVFSCKFKVTVETRGWEHAKEMVELVKKNYEQCSFQKIPDIPPKKSASNVKRGPCLAPNPYCMQR